MSQRPTVAARLALGRVCQRARPAVEAEAGFTLAEMLVVLAILGIVLAGLTTLFTSAVKSQTDQTNRTQAQQDARLGLDKLRREIHCASDVTTPSGYPASLITISLGSYCPTAGGAAATVTWCTKDKNGTTPPVATAQPYTLWRYTGSSCSGTGTQWASNLVNAGGGGSGQIFVAYSPPTQPAMAPPQLTLAPTTGSLGSTSVDTPLGYVVDPVTAAGEQPGLEATVTLAAGTSGRAIKLDWSGSCPPYAGVTAYRVYGRTQGAEQLLATINEPVGPCGTTTFTDDGSTTPSGSSPATRVLARLGVDIPVRVRSATTGLAELQDNIVLRNTPR